MNFLKKVHFPEWSIPLGLLAVCAAAYLPLVSDLGLYWDDWTQLLVHHLYDLPTYWQYFSFDRPFSAWTHILFVPLLGNKPLHWHLLSFVLRWLTVWGMWWTFSKLWPKAKSVVTLAAFLFAVYPSFTQQSDAVAYHQHWLQYALYFGSLGSMVIAVRASLDGQRRRFWWFSGLAVGGLVLHLSITEFFIGVEFLRVLLVWFLVRQASCAAGQPAGWGRRLKQTVGYWLPYLMVDGLFVFWRLFLYAGEKNPPTLWIDFQAQPFNALLRLLRFALVDSLYVLVSAWENVFDLRLFQVSQPVNLFSWFMTIAVALGLGVYLSRLVPGEDTRSSAPANDKQWRGQMLLLGGLVVLLGPAPVWVMGRQLVTSLSLDFHTDRFSMVAMYGASLLFALGVDWLLKDWRRKGLFLAVLVGLATGFHLRTANDYRWMWVAQERFYWQLYWRAPYLLPGTAVVVEDEVLPHQESFSTSSALNFLYPQEKYPEEVAYWMYRLYPRFENGLSEGYMPGFHTTHRIYTFDSSAPDTILVQFDPEQTASCLWVLRPEDRGQPDISPLMNSAIHISNLARISAEAQALPPPDLFGEEPPADWCYYFEKAELARQREEWDRVAALADEARAQGYAPATAPANVSYEWLPFIAGYLHVGRWEEAAELTVLSYQTQKEYGNLLCKLWSEFAEGGQSAAVSEIEAQVGCNFSPAP